MQDTIDDILLYLQGIWLKRRYIILATWLICPIAWVSITLMPNTYQSSARVYADTQSILRPLLKGLSVETDPNQQMAIMVRTLLSRPNLEKIARDADLDISVSTNQDFENLISSLKNNIKEIGRAHV